jgi:hypothetical protein
MWVVNHTGASTSAVFQYTLSTAWDVSTASYASKTFAVGTQAPSPRGPFFSPDGAKMWVVNATGASTSAVFQYTLSTAWDVSTASYASKTFAVGTQAPRSWGLFFSPDGTKMWVANSTSASSSAVFQYTLSTPNPISTTVSSLSVSAGKTTVSYPTQSNTAALISISGRSAAQPTVAYDIDASGYITAKSDRIALPSGKRYAKFKVVGDTGEEVTNAKINLWTI